MTHTLSPTGLALVKKFEGFQAEPLALAAGGWLVGYGHVRLAKQGRALTRPQASEMLALDLAAFERLVNTQVTVPIKQSQFDALVSFAFSVGEAAFVQSQVLHRVNQKHPIAAACALDAWRKAEIDGALETIPALVRRRAAEKALFLKDLPPDPAPSALMRAKLAAAASPLTTSNPHGAPRLAAAIPTAPAQRLTGILKSEPATAALLLTQIAPALAPTAPELTTAHAAPVARKLGPRAPFPPRGYDYHLAAENFGLAALMLFGLGLISIGASILFARSGDAVSMLAGSAVLTPGLAAVLMAGWGLRHAPAPARARA
jgi:lysozyme